MKKIIKLILTIAVVLYLSACKKTIDNTPAPSGAINVTNAVVGGATITLTNNQIMSSSNTVGSNAAAWFPLIEGNAPVNLGVSAVAASATSAAIPAITYFNQTLMVDNTTNYSLFLTGISQANVESILIKETYPRAYADSVCGVRFINLAPGSNPVSVNIKSSANGSEVASLAYKTYSDFIQHPAKKVNASYIFEFRNATTGTLITSYTLATPYFHNVTLCLRGIVGGTTGVIIDYDYQ